METMALASLDATNKEFNGDRRRLYLTGLSMGGYGTWSIARSHAGKFAALIVICGGIVPPAGIGLDPTAVAAIPSDPYTATAKKIGSTPVWVYHGDADPAVPVSESRKMVEALKAVGANVHYTEYPGVGHNSWDAAYGDPELMKWLLSQQLNMPEPKSTKGR